MMKSLRAALLFAVVIAPTARAVEPGNIPLHEAPRSLPEIAFSENGGKPLTLNAWQGKFVLLNIWATWCGPCRAEMPTLDRLQARLGGKKFEVVALSIDQAGVIVVTEFFEKVGIEHLRIFIDEKGRVARDFKVLGLPATLLIGRDGRELGRIVGPAEWDTPEMITSIETVIANQQERN